MNPSEEPTHLPIPDGPWQLDVEPELEERHVQPPVQRLDTQETRRSAPYESTTPPPLHHILEALLFVAHEPLSSGQLCGMIRGLAISHLEDTIRSMNLHYRRQGRPYAIVKQSAGYRLTLRAPFRFHLEELYGSVKEARFSQLAIETLAIIAYRQPLSQVQAEGILGQDAGLPLRQLIKRGMIQIQGQDENNQPKYATTTRFLDYFALAKIDDLPRADDLERL
ncbi:MAG TPA: SMC-Scp complex subunit ScpB [Gemmatales bacterium]|nr:SMC-Scp complex subunit ScpB [Gemmatales bacterium]